MKDTNKPPTPQKEVVSACLNCGGIAGSKQCREVHAFNHRACRCSECVKYFDTILPSKTTPQSGKIKGDGLSSCCSADTCWVEEGKSGETTYQGYRCEECGENCKLKSLDSGKEWKSETLTKLDDVIEKHVSGNYADLRYELKDLINSLLQESREVQLTYLLENGHGGGNWRRLVMQLKEKHV